MKLIFKNAKRKWVDPQLGKAIISDLQLRKMMQKGQLSAIYDLRLALPKNKSKNKEYHVLDPILIKDKIKSHNKKDKIVIISEFTRTYVMILTWGKINGYHHIYLFAEGSGNKKWQNSLLGGDYA